MALEVLVVIRQEPCRDLNFQVSVDLAQSLGADEGLRPGAPGSEVPDLAGMPALPPGTDPDVRALVLSLWIVDWLDHLDRLTVR